MYNWDELIDHSGKHVIFNGRQQVFPRTAITPVEMKTWRYIVWSSLIIAIWVEKAFMLIWQYRRGFLVH